MIDEDDISKPVIFTTGAYLFPMKIKDSEGNDFWGWVVSDFDDTSFRDGDVYNPPEFSDTLNGLLVNTSE